MTATLVGNRPPHIWYGEKLREKHFENSSSFFATTWPNRSDYSIHPAWVSEGSHRSHSAATAGRVYRPWPFEFSGARNWPLRADGSAWKMPPCIPPLCHGVPSAHQGGQTVFPTDPSPESPVSMTLTEQRPAWQRDPVPMERRSTPQSGARSLPLRPRSDALTSSFMADAGVASYSYYHVFTDAHKPIKQPVRNQKRLRSVCRPPALVYSNMANMKWIE